MNEEFRELFAREGTPSTAVAAANAYLAARQVKEDAEHALALASKAMQEAEWQLIQTLERENLLSLKLNINGDGVLLTPVTSTFYSMPAGSLEDETFREWMAKVGGDDLIKKSVNAQSFGAFCRELAEAKKEIHPSVKVAEKKGMRMRKG